MPFNGPSSYLETIDEFLGHWSDVNTALGLSPLILPGGYTRALLNTARGDLSNQITTLINTINDLEQLRKDREDAKALVRERMKQFISFVRGVLGDTNAVTRLPDLVPYAANQGQWILCMRDIRELWLDINTTPPAGFTPPLLLTGGFTQANFATEVTNLETIFTGITQRDQDVEEALRERDEQYQAIRDKLSFYRDAVEGRFPATDPLVLSIPRLEPLPGHTPDPVTLSGSWNAGIVQAALSWTASTDPDLKDYQIRRSAPPYNGNLEIVVATVLPGVLTFNTNQGLPGSGSQQAYKVYVRLTTGNERGSNAVTVVRP